MEAFVTTDNVAVGAKGASFIIDKLGAEGGEVAIIEGKAGNASGEARRNGATEAFKKASQIKLVASQPADWDRIKALDVATNVLQRNPNIKAIYCANDTMAMGVAQAVANAGKRAKYWSSVQMEFRKPANGGSRTNDRDGCAEPGRYWRNGSEADG